MEVLLFPGRLPYSPQNSPRGSLCAVVVHPGKDFLILGRVWEGEGKTVFCFSSMAFSIAKTYFSSMPFSLHYCCGRELHSFVHAIHVELHSVFDMAIERRAD